MGIALQGQGKYDEAIAAYQKALAIKPDYARCYRALSAVPQWVSADPAISKMENIYRSSKNEGDICHVSFALYNVHNVQGNYDLALKYLNEGNRIRYSGFEHNNSKMKGSII